ncbi:MAG: DUF3179 domain-containing protein [Actinomycetota bacterium]|nr:DUF3179 domain-containing protein [Actinomycetota bacterium]
MHARRIAPMLLALAVVAAACTSEGDEPAAGSGESAASSESAPTAGATGLEVPVDPSEIVSGGPPPDGIPPIDRPTFEAPADVTWLEDNEPVLAVQVDDVAKAYPIRIMTWHEIVNDEFGNTPVVVTYCPLCNTGIAFERPVIDGELLDFGTSGKLFNSNLVMYDRQTESYWAQATGQAIQGKLVPEELDFVPARLLSWKDWREAHPEGEVLSIDTGFDRDYGANPYAGYDSGFPFLFTGDVDPRLPGTTHVLGITNADEALALPLEELETVAEAGWAVTEVDVGGDRFVVFWKAGTSSALDAGSIPDGRDVGASVAYVPRADGKRLTFSLDGAGIVDEQTGSRWSISGEAVDGPLEGTQLEVALAIDSFWFDWAAFHPQTAVWSAP